MAMVYRKRKKSLTLHGLCKAFVVLIVGSSGIWYLFTTFLSITPLPRKSDNLDSPYCEIPVIPLRSAAYNRTVTIPEISRCVDEEEVQLTQFLDNGTLNFIRGDLYKREECTAFEILRPEILPNDRHTLRQLPPFESSNQIHSITSEYVMVACREAWSGSLKYNYHRRILPYKEPILRRVQHWEEERGQPVPLSVMLLVLDSTSAADAHRHLPLTMDFLKTKLNFIQFNKFHALGEPTMVNAMPLLLGTSAHALFERRHWTDLWDDNFLIWKDFQNAHYVTSYMEDIPFLGTFNYGLQAGFLRAPTEIYPRPLFTAWELNKKESKKCIGDSSLWKFLLDFQLEILRSLDGIAPSFAIPWLAWPFHDYFGTLSLLDEDLVSFFRSLSSTPSILENTLIIVMADHGFYAHPYSSTHEGLLERRLPLFLIRIPEKLSTRISNLRNIVKGNAERVTSHYDVYKTLSQISQMAGDPADQKSEGFRDGLGQSLLQPIPEGRTCRQAGIPDTWCACNLPSPTAGSGETAIPETSLLDIQPFHLLRIRDFIG